MSLLLLYSHKVTDLIKKNQTTLSVTIYFLASLLLFRFFFITAPPIIWDSGQYSDLADQLLNHKLNVFTFDFGMRTYAHPLFLASLKKIATFFSWPHPAFIYIVNYVLFLLTNLIVYLRIRPLSKPISNLFLILSGFNIITLSFTNTYLTENTSIFLTAVLFFLFTDPKFSSRTAFFLGLTSGLFIYLRPSTLILFGIAFLFAGTKQIMVKNSWMLVFFVLGSFIPIIVGVVNTYNIDHHFSLFTKRTNKIFDMQIRQGPIWIKYETNIDSNYEYPTMYYFHKKNQIINSIGCTAAMECFFAYITKQPLQYGISLVLHIFNMFDRVYLDTYIRNLPARLPLLSLGNYIVLSGALISLFFFSFSKKWKSVLIGIGLCSFGLVAIYIPTVVEPRFSAPVFPFAIILCSYYFYKIWTLRNRSFAIRLVLLQIFLILTFFVISDLVDLTLFNGINRVYS